MKKWMMILIAAAAFSCGDSRSSESNDNVNDNTEIAEPDTTTMESDTTSVNDAEQELITPKDTVL